MNRKDLLFILLAIAITIFVLTKNGFAQTEGSVGFQYGYGNFGERVQKPTSNPSQSIGGYAEGVVEFKAGSSSLSPRLLGSFNRNYPDYFNGLLEDFNSFEIRPELEVKQKLSDDFAVLATGGLSYSETKGEGITRPLVSAGVKYYGIRISVGRFFPSGDANLRSWLFRGDYNRAVSKHLGLALSLEAERAKSEIPHNYTHPGYRGYVIRTRVGVLFK